ncbi:hypothetical protein M1D97_10470 [Kushneria sp. AK178]
MHVTTHPGAEGATHVTLRDDDGNGVDALNMSPFIFELFLAYCQTMTEREAFVFTRDGKQQEAA